MKILYLNHNIRGEGTFFRAFNFAAGLSALGHDMTLLCVSRTNNFTPKVSVEAGVRIIETPRFLSRDGGGWGPFDVLFRLLFVIGEKFDIIHAFDHKPNVYYPALLGKFLRKKTLFFSDWADWWGNGGLNSMVRATPESVIEEKLETSIRKKADALTATSVALENRALSLGLKRELVFYIPSGCSSDRITPAPPENVSAIKKELGLDAAKKTIMFIGFGQGDLGIMFDGFELLMKKRNDSQLVIVGPPEKHIREKAEISSCKNCIVLTGRVEFELVRKYASVADIYLMPLSDTPANRGRGPMKIGDYLSGGKPIIGNPVGDLKDWTRQYGFGVLAEFNKEDCAAKMEYLLDNPAVADEMGKKARHAAENVFSWKQMSDKMNEAYNNTRPVKTFTLSK